MTVPTPTDQSTSASHNPGSPRRRLLGLGLLTASALVLTACGGGGGGEGEGGTAAAGNTLERLQQEGTITVGIAGEVPYSYLEGGEPAGATVAMHEKIFADMGIENVEAELVEWNSLIPGLTAGRFDAVSAGMSILPDRCAQAAFSDPEIMYTTTLMVAEGNPKNLTDLDSVKEKTDAGENINLAVLAGGIEAGYAESLGLKVQSVPDAQTGMDTVANGRADAFAMTAISLNIMAEENPDAGVETTEAFVQVIDGVEQIGAGATVFRQEDTELVEAYNESLASVTESEESYLAVVGDYGFTAENLPPKDLTTEQLCSGDLG
ncbi:MULTISPECIES: ectoine/hydroxyectoine ABC transporter substrate-binding protein EhuB [Micrococcaceae]|uniref:ectoine/hydroxyectoine ABC transporter substrate-binding protein EhuB n=1 Tax=Micrococcaceae TaxID=1268 RepID=UPI001609BF93|nr:MULTISPECIES: ectoine/hydroxyectoine ABC transporter substrate-binding protein EhuB [Micrococcaceae]MBB5750709.1 polar amino acid transport system substrate-binding protein [Micrococcus sp. TA1]HRO28960.1 ectoine/hydroxyectoine ABC transporter substrate-binding protein EhuB [Citricoccus sp.]HRO92900.1 ectoine/hydroxyectoine ABC transporter substrate-binding protein EhuB [Citricoccus sp.]